MGANGWKAGTDPTLRILRIVATLIFMATPLVMVILNRIDAVLGGSLIAGTLVLLVMVEGTARLPNILGGRKDDDDERPPAPGT